MMLGRSHLAAKLVALLAVAWCLADVHAASPQSLRFAGRRLRGPAAESESRSLVPSNNATAAQPEAKLFGATSSPTPGNPNTTLIGGFKIPHINQQVGFGGGPGTAYRELPPNAAAQGGGDSYRQLIFNPSCEASVTVSMPWACGYQTDGSKLFCASIAIIFKNWGDTEIAAPWTLHLDAPSYLGVREAYNWNVSSTDSSGDINGKVMDDWQDLKPGGEAIPSLGGIFNGSVGTSTAFVPAHITVNNDSCTIITLSGQGAPAGPAPTNVTIIENPPSASSPSPPPAPPLPARPPLPPSLPAPPSPPPPPPSSAGDQRGLYQYAFTVPTISQPVAIDGDNTGLIGVDGQPLLLRGINWFGYEDGNTAPDGIWYGSTALSLDIVTVTRRMKLLGYNAVRLPFSFIDLFTEAPKNFNRPCTELSDQQLLDVTTEPGVNIPAGTKVDSRLPFSPAHIAGSCNDYLPNDSTFARFLWNVHMLAANGMYVLIDDHSNFDTTIVTNYSAWLAGWKRMMANIALDPVSKAFVMYDILNEPDSQNLGWDFMTKAYLDVMEQGSAINPDAVYFVEGCGQGRLGANWGDGFTTNTSLINPGTSNDPNKFFTTLVSSSHHVVVSPHVYPPTITTATSAYTGPAFWTRLSYSFGQFNTGKGYCTSSGQCKKFPVIIGEFGSRLTDPRDIACLNDFKEYIQNTGPAVDGMHAAITSWFWWAWNANSADTGGMVEDDWTTIIWNKVDYHKSIGLQPWYTQLASEVTESTPTPETSSVSPPPPPPPPPPTPTQTRSQPTQTPSAEPTQQPTKQPTKQPTEQSSPPPTEPASPPPPQPPPSPPAPPKQLATWSQCGGESGCPKDSGSCTDAPWSAWTCGPGDGCVRSDQWYWQCRRGEATTVPTAAPTAAPTAEPTAAPTSSPTAAPSSAPTRAPTTEAPTPEPTAAPTPAPQTAAPTPAPTQAPTLVSARVQTMARFYQCGGRGGGCTGTCGDAIWSGVQCEKADSCIRQNQWYWQCLPADVPTLAPTSAPTPAPQSQPTPAPQSQPTPAPQSQPTPAPTSSRSDGDQNRELGFDLYAQCGGKSNCPSGVNCGDNAWDGGCSSGSCQQQSEWYWQCLPSGSSPSPTPAPQSQPSPAPTSDGDNDSSSSSDDQNRSAGGGTFDMYAQCGGTSNCPSDVNCGDNVWNSGCSSGSCQRQSQWYYQCL